MDPHSNAGYEGHEGEGGVLGEGNTQTFDQQVVGRRAIHSLRNILTAGSLSTTLAVLGFAPTSVGVEPLPHPGDNGPLISTTPRHRPRRHHLSPEDCTVIAYAPQGFYEGEACTGDVLYKLHESKPTGFSYGELVVSGVRKCGWVADRSVKTYIDHNPWNPCNQYFKALTNDPNMFVQKPNCEPGKCEDGSPTPETSTCTGEEYGNFATKRRSILNLDPEGRSGLEQPKGQQHGTVLYRYLYNQTNHRSAPAIVRINNPHFEWGYMPGKCIPTQAIASSYNLRQPVPISVGP